MIDLSNIEDENDVQQKQVVQSAKQEEPNMSDNTASGMKAETNLDKIDINPIDDMERLMQEIEDQTQGESPNARPEDDLENEGNITRLVDKI